MIVVFTAALLEAINCANHAMSPIAGLCASGAIPLMFAVGLFDAKVDAVLGKGRWLYALVPEAQARLDNAQDHWARMLLGADWWRNGAVCRSELGWSLSGFARAVRCVALRRARMWHLPANDWYLSFFAFNAAKSLGWAHASKCLLQVWHVPDWPEVWHVVPTYDGYKELITKKLQHNGAGSWAQEADKHSAQVPYRTFQRAPSDALSSIASLDLTWAQQLRVRSWCRLRAGLICLRNLHGRQSMARHQKGIFCGLCVRNATKHVLERAALALADWSGGLHG